MEVVDCFITKEELILERQLTYPTSPKPGQFIWTAVLEMEDTQGASSFSNKHQKKNMTVIANVFLVFHTLIITTLDAIFKNSSNKQKGVTYPTLHI